MVGKYWNVEWLDQNSQRSYPLTDWSTKVDITGTLTIPDSLILGLYFPVAANIEILPDRFYISELVLFSTGIAISISYDDDTASPGVVATAQIAISGHDEYDVYALPGKNEFADSVGRIIVGRLDILERLPTGRYTFTPQAGALEADAIQPMISGVTALVVGNTRYQDDIVLEEGENIQFTVDEDEHGRTRIRIDAIDGTGLTEPDLCGDRTAAGPIRTLNGLAPTATGDFTFSGNVCLEVVPTVNGLQFVDKCSEPCCDCNDLKALVEELELLTTQSTTVQGFYNHLQSVVSQMNQTVLGSLLGDRGCQVCVVEL